MRSEGPAHRRPSLSPTAFTGEESCPGRRTRPVPWPAGAGVKMSSKPSRRPGCAATSPRWKTICLWEKRRTQRCWRTWSAWTWSGAARRGWRLGWRSTASAIRSCKESPSRMGVRQRPRLYDPGQAVVGLTCLAARSWASWVTGGWGWCCGRVTGRWAGLWRSRSCWPSMATSRSGGSAFWRKPR
jgi:hypothetical protein